MDNLFANLNEKQMEAVKQITGPLMVVAGAGSGKTRVLTHRIAHMIEQGIAPRHILAITFTNKAAGEMRERISGMLGAQMGKNFAGSLPWVGTFHAFGVQFLRREITNLGYDNNFLIYDDTDQESLVKKIMAEMRLLEKDKKKINAVISLISAAKSSLMDAETFAHSASNEMQKLAAEVYLKYEKIMRSRSAVDFDDLLYLTVKILQKFPEIQEKYNERFQYISVDEYQDTNHAQYTLTKLLAERDRNVCVIGDSDQSIYSWRGADYTNLLSFKADYPEAKIVLLEQNYRSTKNILAAGNAVIAQNKNREKKELWTAGGNGEKIQIRTAETEQEEARMIIREIKNLNDEIGVPYADMAVLYRLSAQSRAIEEACLKNGIPYKLVGGLKFYSRKEVKDLLSYCRIARYPQDDEGLLRIINIPARKLGATSIEHLVNFARINALSLYEAIASAESIDELTPSAKRALVEFAEQLKSLQQMAKEKTAAGVILYVCEEVGYRKYLLDGSEEGETRWENILELISVAKKYDELEPGQSLQTFLEDSSLFTSLDETDLKEDSLTLMTLHSAKGLEFPNIFIAGMEDGILPHSRAHFDPEQLEEERRLFYVGVTRAKERLFLLRAKRRMLYGGQYNPPSRFLMDLPAEICDRDEDIDDQETEFLNRLKSFAGKRNNWY